MYSCCQNWCVSWILGCGGSHPSEAVWGCWSSQSSADGSVSHILHVKGNSFILVGAEQFFTALITNYCCIGLDSNDLNDFSIFLIKLFAVFGVLPLYSLTPSAWGRLYLVSPGCCSLLSPPMALLYPSLHPCGSFGVISPAVPEFSAVLFFLFFS